MTERHVTLTEVRDLLAKAEVERGELTYEQKLASEHAKRFARYTSDGAKKILAELQENPKIDNLTAIRIADIAPSHADDVRALTAKGRTTLTDAEVQKVLDTVAKYVQA